MKEVTQQQLSEILELHKKWLNNKSGGVRADLSGSDLRGSDLRGSDLRYSDLGASDLRASDLRTSDLSWCDLRASDLRYSDLSDSDLSSCDLSDSDLRGSNLRGSNLSGADLTNITFNENTTGLTNLCPEGSFIAWKKLQDNVIAKLLIPEHAKRSNATTLKCRASKAKVLQILKKENDTWVEIEKGVSKHDSDFIYKVGKTVKVDNFDENRWNECSTGIHFFIDRQLAEQY